MKQYHTVFIDRKTFATAPTTPKPAKEDIDEEDEDDDLLLDDEDDLEEDDEEDEAVMIEPDVAEPIDAVIPPELPIGDDIK